MSIQNIVTQLHKFHHNYIEKTLGIVEDKFLCLHPDHSEDTPSAHFIPETDYIYCFGCHKTYNIIQSYAYMNSTPLQGEANWIELTLKPLCELFGIEFSMENLSPEEQEFFKAVKLHEDILTYAQSFPYNKKTLAEIKKRGWQDSICRSLSLFNIDSHQALIDHLILTYSQDYLQQYDLYNPILFNPNNLFFPIRNTKGYLVGFNAKNLDFSKTNQDRPKYIHSPNSNIFSKRELLYGLDKVVAKKHHNKVLWIVEGSGDYLTLFNNGIENVAALNCSSLTYEHCNLLRSLDFQKVILCLDGDKAGKDGIDRIVTELLPNLGGITLEVKALPDGLDPDDYIRKHGIASFHSLPTKNIFSWKLEQYPEGKDSHEIAEEMLSFLPNITRNPLKLDQYIKLLNKHTDISIGALESRLEEILDADATKTAQVKQNAIQGFLHTIRVHPETAREQANRLIEVLDDLEVNKNNKYGFAEFNEFVNELKLQEENSEGAFQGFTLTSKPKLQNILYGNWKQEKTIYLGGDPNVGKSNFLVDLVVDILRSNDGIRKDPYGCITKPAIVFYHTIDDSRSAILNRIITNIASYQCHNISMNMIANPKRWKNEALKLEESRQFAYNIVQEWVSKGRLLIKGIEASKNLSFANLQLKKLRKIYPATDFDIVYIMDNLSKTNKKEGKEDQAAISEVSEMFKEIAVINKVCAIASVEYRKRDTSGKESPDERFKGSNQYFYDGDITLHLLNDSAYNTNSSQVWYSDKDLNPVHSSADSYYIWPIVELLLSKNKTSEFRQQSLYYKALPLQAKYMEISGNVE